jgi:hypothetical protein
LSRQFSRLKKAQVKTITYLDTHSDLLALVLPKEPLLAAVACRGEWGQASDAIQQLLASGPLGKSLFTFAGLAANSAAFAKDIEAMLDIVIAAGFDDSKINDFKAQAAKKTEEFQAVREIP